MAKIKITVTRKEEGYATEVRAVEWNASELLAATAALIQSGAEEDEGFLEAVEKAVEDFRDGKRFPNIK